MKRYFIECHVDGEMTATTSYTITARGEREAVRKAAVEMRLDYDRTDLTVQEFIDDVFYCDSCTELEDGASFGSPVTNAVVAMGELLNNRQHLDLHDDDRRMLQAAMVGLDRWSTARMDVL